MKKITSILCLLALTVGLLAGCGSTSGTATTAETTAAPAAETTVETTAETTAAPTEPAVPVRLGAMTGPTGIGMVKLFQTADENPDSGYTYTIKGAADELTPMILQGELDIVSVPANLASVLYNKTEGGVQALAVNVLGVLYVAEFNGETVQSVADLKGKTHRQGLYTGILPALCADPERLGPRQGPDHRVEERAQRSGCHPE